jgi:hypothetical protein
MEWPLAIERHRLALLGIVDAIAALLGGRDGDGPITRGLRRAALALLRPAEAAARRLIFIAAQGLVVTPRAPRPPLLPIAVRSGAGTRRRAFALLDRPKRYAPAARIVPRGVPRIRSFWGAAAFAPTAPTPSPVAVFRPDPAALVDSTGLRFRLAALDHALADIAGQARRLARRRARAPEGARRQPLRFGSPPGYRLKPVREVDLVLRECHALALDAQRRDTS